jgi:hypothetical protein
MCSASGCVLLLDACCLAGPLTGLTGAPPLCHTGRCVRALHRMRARAGRRRGRPGVPRRPRARAQRRPPEPRGGSRGRGARPCRARGLAVAQVDAEHGRAVVRALQDDDVAVLGRPRARLEALTADQEGATYCSQCSNLVPTAASSPPTPVRGLHATWSSCALAGKLQAVLRRATRRSARRSWARPACCGCRHALLLLGVAGVETSARAAAGLPGREGSGVDAAVRARASGYASGGGCGCFHRSGCGACTAQRGVVK